MAAATVIKTQTGNIDGQSAEAARRAEVKRSLSEKIGLVIGAAISLDSNIIRVPDDILKGHDEAYVPRMFFIGPYHKRDSPMQETKLLYLNDLLSRDLQNNASCYVDKIFNVLKEARKQYSDRDCVNQISDEDFVEMLVVDGCFIIEFLLKRAENEGDQIVSGQVRVSQTLQRDLLLLENQIPFFVLQTILQNSKCRRTNIPGNNNITLIDLALNYVSKGEIKKHVLIEKYRKESEIYHLLHLSYLCHVTEISNTQPPRRNIRYYIRAVLFFWRKPNRSLSNEESTDKPWMIPSASELKEAGVTFKKKDKNTKFGYLDVFFDREGFFHIPLLSIQESTDSVFRNFLAFEQTCHPYVGNNFTSYVILMDTLIKTSTDVAILKRKGVLQSKLGCDEDVVNLFNEMRSGLCFDFNRRHYLSDTFKDVNCYWNTRRNRWRAKLVHDYLTYFSINYWNTWTPISVVAATVLLGLTATQTVFSVLSFYE